MSLKGPSIEHVNKHLLLLEMKYKVKTEDFLRDPDLHPEVNDSDKAYWITDAKVREVLVLRQQIKLTGRAREARPTDKVVKIVSGDDDDEESEGFGGYVSCGRSAGAGAA